MRGKLLVVSDWLINGSLKFYSRIATPFAKGGQLLKRSPKSIINSTQRHKQRREIEMDRLTLKIKTIDKSNPQ